MLLKVIHGSVQWGERMYSPADGPFEISTEAGEIYVSHGAAEVVAEEVEPSPVEVVEAAPVVEDNVQEVEVHTVEDPSVELLDTVDAELADKLAALGIYTVSDLALASVEELTEIKGIGKVRATKLIASAQ